MRIDNWPINRIMQLPDHVFGRRYGVFVCPLGVAGAASWDISEVALPDVCVVWEIRCWFDRYAHSGLSFRLALGDSLPATVVEMDGFEPLFNGLGLQGPGPRQIPMPLYSQISMVKLKMPVQAQGRRVVAEITPLAEEAANLQVCLVVSGIPKEVPDWLDSGSDKKLL